MDEETREILDSFVSEGYERLDDSESQLSRLEAGNETAVLNSVFRIFHSVKGSAGYLGLDHVNCHKHLHLHPTVFALIVEIGAAYGLKAVRLPYEPISGAAPDLLGKGGAGQLAPPRALQPL